TLTLTEESFFPLWEALALVGVLACLATRRLLLPAWLVAMFLLDARSALTTATVPIALLASIGITDALLPFLHGAARAGAKAAGGLAGNPERYPGRHLLGNRLATYTLAFMLLYATLAAQMGRSAFLAGLAPDERDAMSWIAHAAPAGAVLAITAEPSWARDRVAEWLPGLAERPGVATVQGYEWLGKPGLDARGGPNVHAQRCAYEGADCLEAWAREAGLPFALVYVSRHAAPSLSTAMAVDDCCASLRAALGADPRYRLVYDGPGAAVYRRLTPG